MTSNLPAPASILVTQALADDLFGEEDALGKTIYWGSMEPSTIVGIIGHMQGSWVGWDKLNNAVIMPGKPARSNSSKYIIRVEPGMRDELFPVIEAKLGESNRQRVILAMRTLEEMAARSVVERFYSTREVASIHTAFVRKVVDNREGVDSLEIQEMSV